MDPNPKNFPILSYVMAKLPTFRRSFSSAADFDVENPLETSPKPREPHFEITERMPHLNNCKLIDEMRRAVSDVVQARLTLSALGTRPDHEEVDAARLRLSEIDAHSSKDSEEIQEECKLFKAVISLDEMHAAYEKMLSEAERRLEKIYEAAVAGAEVIEEEEGENECGDAGKEEINEEVLAILKEAESGKVIERVELSKRRLRIFPEAFGTLKSLVVLRLSDNQLETIPDSIVGLENLEELNLSANLLESLPDAIGFLFKLKVLDASRNKLTTLPDSISQCRLLVELEASFNKLTYLPTHIGLEMRILERLSISLNKIRSLPTSIGDMKSLRILDVHFNELHGLPNSIGKLTNLEVLNLSSNFNDLTKLPDTIANLTNLKELDVSNNQIHMLPDTFGGLSSLIKLNIDQNPLVVPPKEVVAQGVEAIKAYMDKRWVEILREEDEKNMKVSHNEAQAGSLLGRSTSWLNNFVSNISGTVSGYLGAGAKSEADSYLNQQL